MTDTIDIALASDANYFPGLLVTACSMARHASRQFALRFNVLDGGLSAGQIGLLEEKAGTEHPAVSFRYFKIDQNRFSAFPEWSGPSKMAYARLLIAELIGDAEFAIYSDLDFLWRSDIAELWALKSTDKTIQGCLDLFPDGIDDRRRWYDERGIPVAMDRHVCSGLMIINLHRFRSAGCSAAVMEFLRRHPDSPLVDQTAINAVVSDVGILPREWMRFSYELRDADFAKAKAIHFAGDAPWVKHWWGHTLLPPWKLWHGFYGGLNGTDAWESLRRVYSVREIAVRRAVHFVVVHSPLRALFFLFLRLVRRGSYIPSLREKARRYVD